MDLSADFFLETVEQVFQKNLLPLGKMQFKGETIEPRAIRRPSCSRSRARRTIFARSARRSRRRICAAASPYMKTHHMQAGVGHYGVFNGRRWETQIYPVVRNHIQASRCTASAGSALRRRGHQADRGAGGVHEDRDAADIRMLNAGAAPCRRFPRPADAMIDIVDFNIVEPVRRTPGGVMPVMSIMPPAIAVRYGRSCRRRRLHRHIAEGPSERCAIKALAFATSLVINSCQLNVHAPPCHPPAGDGLCAILMGS